MTQKKKGFLRRLGRGAAAIAKTPRECLRIADQAIDLANHITDKSGLAKHFSGSGRVGVTRSSGRNGGTNIHYQQNNRSPTVGIGINTQGTPEAFVNNQAVVHLVAPNVHFYTAPAATTERHVQVNVPLQPAIVENTDAADTEIIEAPRPTLGAPIYSANQFRRTTDDFAVQLNALNQLESLSDSWSLIPIRPISQSGDTLASRTNIESQNLDKWRENYGGKPTVSRVMWMYATNQLLPKDRAFVARALGAGVVEGIRTGEEETFGRVRAATGAVVSYFETDRAIRDRYAQVSGARVDMTSMSYAAPALARLATSFIPETPVELGLAISPAPVLFGMGKSLRFLVLRKTNISLTNKIETIHVVNNKRYLAQGLSKNDAREFIIQNQHILFSEHQVRGVMKAIKNIVRANGELDILKITATENIRVYSRRPGHNGLQSFIAEIRTDGTTRAVLQTAVDSLGNFVQQKPGQLKNNIFDIKKFSME